MDGLWGRADSLLQLQGDHEFTIFPYMEGDIPINPQNTWNEHPAVNYGEIIGTVLVSYFFQSSRYLASQITFI